MSHGTAALLAETYARSLLELAEQSRLVDDVQADLETLAALLAQEPSFPAFLSSPYFAEETQRDLVRRTFEGALHPMTLHFLFVIIDHNRGKLLPEMIERYRGLYRALRGYRTVTAVVARPLRDDQKTKLAQDLAAAMHAQVDLDVQVDPSLLGGVVLRYGDRMLDNSLRGRLVRTVGRIADPQRRQQSL